MKAFRNTVIVLFSLSLLVFLYSEIFVNLKKDTTYPEIVCDSGLVKVNVTKGEKEFLKGVTAFDEKDGDLTDRIIVESLSNLIDKNTVNVTYAVYDNDNHVTHYKRNVQLVDYHPARFKIEKPLKFNLGSSIDVLSCISAHDIIDGDITNRMKLADSQVVATSAGTYKVTVQVSNSIGDVSYADLSVVIENASRNAPAIELTDYLIYLKKGEEFDPQTYFASASSWDGMDLSKRVKVNAKVDTETVGTYEAVFAVSDGDLNSTAILTVVVEE